MAQALDGKEVEHGPVARRQLLDELHEPVGAYGGIGWFLLRMVRKRGVAVNGAPPALLSQVLQCLVDSDYA